MLHVFKVPYQACWVEKWKRLKKNKIKLLEMKTNYSVDLKKHMGRD